VLAVPEDFKYKFESLEYLFSIEDWVYKDWGLTFEKY
jgi:hypothetical protein